MKHTNRIYTLFLLLFLTFTVNYHCLAQQSLTVALAITQNPCDHDGVVTATVTGGTAPYTYTWFIGYQNPAIITTTNVLSNYSGGTSVNVSVTDANGLLGWDWINPNGLPFQLDWIGGQASICPGSNGSLTFNVSGGTAPFSYVWYNNGNIVGTTTVPTISGLSGGVNYDVEVTDANGCKLFYHDINDSLSVASNTSIQASLSTTPANCVNGTATVNPFGGVAPYSYDWAQVSPTNLSLNNNTNTAANLVKGNVYMVSITDGQSCTLTSYVYPQGAGYIYANTSVTAATCTSSNGTVNVTVGAQQGATLAPPYVYSWSNGTISNNALLSNLPTGFYFCNITDANGCTTQASASVGSVSPISIVVTKTNTSSCINPDGTASVSAIGGQVPYAYSWSTGQTTSSISGLNMDIPYSVWVTDANGCTQHQTFQITYTNLGNYTISTTPSVCNTPSGTATANLNGGVAPYTYSWNTGQNTQTINNLLPGNYACNVIDANGCEMNAVPGYYVVFNSSPITVTANITAASCSYTSDGGISVTANGGTPPYQYSWYALTQTGQSLAGLSSGNYCVFVNDAAGCTTSHCFYVPHNSGAACTSTIKGYIYNDLNLNCVQDAGEVGIQGVQVYCTPIGGYVFTNASGYYEFNVPPGTYHVSYTPNLYYSVSCPTNLQTVSFATTGLTTWVNFGQEMTVAQDLRTDIFSYASAVVGSNTYSQTYYIKNIGTVAVSSAELHVYPDAAVNVVNNTGFSLVSANHYRKNYGILYPGQTANETFTYSIPTTIPFGTALSFSATAIPNTGAELTPFNNTDNYNANVVAPYDPNYKEVFPKGKGTEGFITAEDSILQYVIHFQNTGNSPAVKVVLKDTLDSNLDIESVNMGYGTHPYTAKIDMNNILEITFDNINLPDSSVDYEGSMGFVAFTIKQKQGLAIGTKFTNAADIYFDYNYPIHTNMVLNTLSATSSVNPILESISLQVYPNPSAENLNVILPREWQNKALNVRCLDIMGKEVAAQWEMNEGKGLLYIEHLSNGWYFLQVSDGQTILTQKFGVAK